MYPRSDSSLAGDDGRRRRDVDYNDVHLYFAESVPLGRRAGSPPRPWPMAGFPAAPAVLYTAW